MKASIVTRRLEMFHVADGGIPRLSLPLQEGVADITFERYQPEGASSS